MTVCVYSKYLSSLEVLIRSDDVRRASANWFKETMMQMLAGSKMWTEWS